MRKIAIQGIKGAFHEEAAINYFDEKIELRPCNTFKELCEAVVNDTADYGIMAIENTISGNIQGNYELIRTFGLKIIGEEYLSIQQNLGVVAGASLESLREVRSHYMALNQCRDYFNSHQHISLVESIDTAMSIKDVAELGDKGIGAIGSALAIEHYGLIMLAEGIQTNENNYTRFAILAKEDDVSENDNKVSLSLVSPHESGSLCMILKQVELYNANMTMIQSSPIISSQFKYRFHLDLTLKKSKDYEPLINSLQSVTEELQVLGKYRSANK